MTPPTLAPSIPPRFTSYRFMHQAGGTQGVILAIPAMTTRPLNRIGLLTGGGDCPGINAVIRAVTKQSLFHGIGVVGIEDGFLGLIENRVRDLSLRDVSNILATGGTILGSSNKDSPLRFPAGLDAAGSPVYSDVTDRCLANLRKNRLDALVIVGGDGTMTIAAHLAAPGGDARAGVPVLGIPKTIDNDMVGTDLTFGFLTAVATATDALDRVHTTAASHHRALVVEVMGRNAGWIALHAGVASGADVILIPEIPFSLAAVARVVAVRSRAGSRYSVICAAEGARPAGGQPFVLRTNPGAPEPIRLGGVGRFVADTLENLTGIESRHVVLGHVQRGGPPIAADRVLATRFGHHAMTLLRAGRTGRMVAMAGLMLTDVPIAETAGKQRLVPTDHPLLAAARSVYTSFGDEPE
jgi:phosphofructokinase-like protein